MHALLLQLLVAMGPVFGPLFLILLVAFVSASVFLIMDLLISTSIPPNFVKTFTDTVSERKFKEAFELARNDPSFLARVVTAGMGRLQYGINDAQATAADMVKRIRDSKEKLIAYLATIGSLGPMLALVGTVFGMIQAVVLLQGRGGVANANAIADGITHSLVVTLFGIALSVPIIFCHAFFRNRLIRITLDTTTIADALLTLMHDVAFARDNGHGPDALSSLAPTKPPPVIFPASGSAEP